LALSKAWNKANPEKTLVAGRKAYAKDPSKAAARYAKRRANKKQATPAWADTKELHKFYLQARLKTLESEIAWEVDHIVPLAGVNVCGLHVPWNLQVIPATDNRRKQNRLTI
jgi:5-methylcytosine-specific restriction endonuclease McrA